MRECVWWIMRAANTQIRCSVWQKPSLSLWDICGPLAIQKEDNRWRHSLDQGNCRVICLQWVHITEDQFLWFTSHFDIIKFLSVSLHVIWMLIDYNIFIFTIWFGPCGDFLQLHFNLANQNIKVYQLIRRKNIFLSTM